jgi:hypothetical protein
LLEGDPICGPYAGRPCTETLGPRKAQELADRCLKVSSDRYPQCEVTDTCAALEDEIERGCEVRSEGVAPLFCKRGQGSERDASAE